MSRSPLILALLAFLILGLALIIRVPLGASPDEAAHWQYMEFLVANKTLPTFTGQVPPAPGYEFHQPPLYYLLAAPNWAILPAGAQNYWARLLSLLCGAVTLIFIWKSALLVFPDDRSIAILATGLGALWPLHLGVSAGANNDALAGLWAAALFWSGARVLIQGANWRDVALIGIFAGLGALTKNTDLTVGALALAALLVAPRAEQKSPARGVGVLAALAIMIVLAGPLWARNSLLYGDPFALRLFSQAASAASPGFWAFEAAGGGLLYVRFMVWQLFLTAWGFFGGPNTAIAATQPMAPNGPIVPELWLAPLMLGCGLAPLAALLGLRRYQLTPAQKRVTWFWLAGFAVVALLWAQFAFAHIAGGQARYFHAALLPLCLFAALGWRGLWGDGPALKIASLAMAALLLTLTALNLLVWKTLV